MPLDFQLSQVPFRFGLSEGTDPHQVPPGTLTTAENIVWDKVGRVSKRFGTTGLTRSTLGGSTLSAASRLFARGNELCLIDGTSLYTYSPNFTKWRKVDKVSEVGLTWQTAIDAHIGVGAADIAVSGNLVIIAWAAGGDVSTLTYGDVPYVQVFERSTGAMVLPPTRLTTSVCNGLRVLVSGTTAFILTRQGANIAAWSLDLTTVTLNNSGTAVNLRTDSRSSTSSNQGGWDACLIGSNITICYESTAPALKLYSYSFSAPATYTQQATGGITSELGTNMTAISIDGASGETLYVLYCTQSATKTRIAMANPSTLAQTVAPVDLDTTHSSNYLAVKRYDASNCVAVWSTESGSATDDRTVSQKVSNAGTLDATTVRGTYHTRLLCRPFNIGSNWYVVVVDYPYNAPGGTGSGQSTVSTNTYLLELDLTDKGSLGTFVPHRYIGKIDQLIGGTFNRTFVANAATYSSTETILAVPFLATVSTTSDNWRQGLRLVSVLSGTAIPADQWRSYTFNNEAYISGPVLSAYDSQRLFDYGAAKPVIFTTTLAAGSLTGAYLLAYTQEFRSATGTLHRSMVQYNGATLNPSTQSISSTCFNICVQNKLTVVNGGLVSTPKNLAVVGWRSIAGGSTYFRVSYEPAYNTAYEDPTTGTTVGAAGGVADSNIAGGFGLSHALSLQPTLYTTGGIFDDEQPPAFITMLLHRQRLWGIDGSQRQLWYSKSFFDDLGTAPGFSSNFRILLDQPGTALATLDDKLIIFWSGGIWYIYGEGPTPAGTSSDYPANPIAIQTDVGCTNPRSVVSMPDGVMFQSARGLYLLDRKLQVSWIGRPVEDTLATYPSITSATLVAKYNQVRFTANKSDGSAGVVIVYDYVANQWAVFKYTDTVSSTYGCPIADACMWQGSWTFAATNGAVYEETESTYLDAGSTWVPMVLETAWVSATGPLAFQSVRSLQLEGKSNSNHDLTISVGFDSDTSYPQTKTFTAGSTVTSIGTLEQCEIAIGTRRKCQHIRFKMQDATPTNAGSYPVGTGQGPTFDMMGIEIGIKKGFAPNPATKKG